LFVELRDDPEPAPLFFAYVYGALGVLPGDLSPM
jgi:hypothetical protein